MNCYMKEKIKKYEKLKEKKIVAGEPENWLKWGNLAGIKRMGSD